MLSSFLLSFGLGFYLIIALQWFNYRIERVLFHYTKPLWHLYFAILPVIFYTIFVFISDKLALLMVIFYLFILYFWHKRLDKKLVFTMRVKKFFAILAIVVVIQSIFVVKYTNLATIFVLASVFVSFLLSYVYEKFIINKFKLKAKTKIDSIKDLQIILITASFGKTSIKNFLFEMLKNDFNVHKTPRSVNTFTGIIKDINENLPFDTQIYIVEAGARLSGDIRQISEFLNPHFVIVGEIGLAHLEYFKTVENIRSTKLEALLSNRLKMAFLHSSTNKNENENLILYDKKLLMATATLDGLSFVLKFNGENLEFRSELLGEFNAENLTACVLLALSLGVELEALRLAVLNLKSVEHRLQKINSGGKIIIDDSFNGNLKGMSLSFNLVKDYKGRKVLLTPGIIEGDKADNEKLSKLANEIFDIVVITSHINENELKKHLSNPEVIILTDKSKMTNFLAQNTMAGDLILFSNDAPAFV